MTNEKAESITMSDMYEYNKKNIKENFEPVEDKPGYVWFSKRNFQMIDIETFAKLLEVGKKIIQLQSVFSRK